VGSPVFVLDYGSNLSVTMAGPETTRLPEQTFARDAVEVGDEVEDLKSENARLAGELARVRRSNELFGTILGHDLRNPLGAMLMSATVLSRKIEDESLKRALTRILTAGNRMNHMITDLLDFTRARGTGGLRIESARTDLAPIFRHALDELAEATKGRRTTFEVEGDTRGQWDPARMAQVASSLVGNAVRHGDPDGEIGVRIDGREPDQITVEVRSTGPIPAELLPVLFEPFQNGDLHNRRGGLGLGLFLTREIISAHGGKIEAAADSAVASFRVVLPRGLDRASP
jgi:two-component system, sensor histidine kinase and response regulator